MRLSRQDNFVPSSDPMSTTGKRYTDRTGDPSVRRILDQRTRTVLDRVLHEQRGRRLEAYLMALGQSRTGPSR